MPDDVAASKPNATRWLGYYTKKRITHQWTQLLLVGMTDAVRILEIGPALGAVTALLRNAGYEVTTLDRLPQEFVSPRVPHILCDLADLDPADIAGHDAILCCETLEHLPWNEVDGVLRKFHASGARHLMVSVPYMASQLTLDLYWNAHVFRRYFSLKKFTRFREFTPEPEFGHQWEVGYRGHDLKAWEEKLAKAGYSMRRREFSEHCRSVFHLLSRN